MQAQEAFWRAWAQRATTDCFRESLYSSNNTDNNLISGLLKVYPKEHIDYQDTQGS